MDLKFDNFFEKQINEISELIDILKTNTRNNLLKTLELLKTNTKYEFWFLINNFETIFYYLINKDQDIGIKEYNSFKKIKLEKQNSINIFGIKHLKIDNKTIIKIENLFLENDSEIQRLFFYIINKFDKQTSSLYRFEELIKENCTTCKFYTICEFKKCQRIKEIK